MSAKENVQLMRRWFDEVWNQGKAETVHELLAEDAIGMGQGEPDVKVRGPADFVPFVERIRGAFPDINIKIEDAFGARDKVVVRWSATIDAQRRPFGHSCERQASPNHRHDDGSHSQRPDRGRLGQLGPTRDDATDRSLWTTRGCTAEEDCVVTSF